MMDNCRLFISLALGLLKSNGKNKVSHSNISLFMQRLGFHFSLLFFSFFHKMGEFQVLNNRVKKFERVEKKMDQYRNLEWFGKGTYIHFEGYQFFSFEGLQDMKNTDKCSNVSFYKVVKPTTSLLETDL